MEFFILYLEREYLVKQGFHVFLANCMHIFLYKGRNCTFVLCDIEKIP